VHGFKDLEEVKQYSWDKNRTQDVAKFTIDGLGEKVEVRFMNLYNFIEVSGPVHVLIQDSENTINHSEVVTLNWNLKPNS
jgi:hypothetical protein